MQLTEFFEKVEENENYEGVNIVMNDQYFIIRNKKADILFKVPFKDVINSDWNTLHRILNTETSPTPVQGMSRIVGYFSMIHNWNASKKGELKDRQKGNYDVGV